LGVDGISDFEALYSGQHNEEVQLYAFDILIEGGDDRRKLPLHPAQPSNAYWRADPRAFSSTPSSAAKSVPICFVRPAGCA
jgi:hypothetical protein